MEGGGVGRWLGAPQSNLSHGWRTDKRGRDETIVKFQLCRLILMVQFLFSINKL